MAIGKHVFSIDAIEIVLLIEQRKQRDVRKTNETYTQLINQALPIEVQQEAEKERLSREKGKCKDILRINGIIFLFLGSFSENYDDVSPSNVDGTYPPSSTSPTIVPNSSSTSLLNNSTVNNSQTQSSSSSLCTVSKRSSKISNSDGVSSSHSNSFVQSTATRNNKTPTMTTSNGHDDGSSSYKQQKPNVTMG